MSVFVLDFDVTGQHSTCRSWLVSAISRSDRLNLPDFLA